MECFFRLSKNISLYILTEIGKNSKRKVETEEKELIKDLWRVSK